jgi:CRP-like cAMP-binding protein
MPNSFLMNLGSRDTITAEEQMALLGIFSHHKTYRAGEEIVAEGSRPGHSLLLVEGLSVRSKVLAGGERQITAIHIPGDFVDLHSFLLKRMDHSVVALTPCRLVMAEHEAIRKLMNASDHLTRLLWLTTVIDGAVHREWLVAMGQLSAYAHMAHVFCEMFVRLRIVGLTIDLSYRLPITQVEMGDVLGLSSVHVNRTLQELRGSGLMSWDRHTVTINNWDGLVAAGQFDPTYLSMQSEPR